MSYQQCENWIRTHRDYLMDAVRIYLGIGLLIKGAFFLAYPAQMPIPADAGPWTAVVPFVPYLHIVGGLFLALGCFTRLAALVQIPVLFGALFYVALPQMADIEQREGVELAGLVLFLMVLICLWGPGRLAMQPGRPVNRHLAWFKERPDVFLDLVRAYLGVGLFIKGYYLMEHREEFLLYLEDAGSLSMIGVAAAHYVIPAHFAGGVLLALGLVTRVAALLQLPVLIGAVYFIHLPQLAKLELRQNLELGVLVLFLLTLLTLHNSGRFSLDYVLQKGSQAALRPQPAQ